MSIKLLFYCKVSSSKNVIRRTLMYLPGVSDYMFLCAKYGVRPTSTRDGIKDALTHAFMALLSAYL